ncbi:MAG TPA: hemin receptor [Verrucomicrobiales bacterium]|nr:hemin receptor [Verrucomicrobiales bacterium]
MNLSPDQIALVRSTFALLEPKARVAAMAFYQRLFARRPELRAHVQPHWEEEADKFVALLRTAATFADEPGAVRPLLSALGRGQREVVGEALLWALATTLGRDFTPEARDAWAALNAELNREDSFSPRAGV